MPERPPDVDTFSRQFRMKYGRDMTDDERRCYKLTRDPLEFPPEEEQAKTSRKKQTKLRTA